jgi:RimJ/RimL family protein N-acetyltransferase
MSYSTPFTLAGRVVQLEPLSVEHAPALFEALAGDEDTWRYMPIDMPATPSRMRDWVEGALGEHRQGTRLPFAVVLRESGRVIGSTSYLSIVEADRKLEIGWT